MNPLDLPGPAFLVLYVTLVAGAAALASHLRSRAMSPPESTAAIPDAYEIAWMAGGPERVLEGALAALLQRRTIGVDKTSGRLVVLADLPAGTPDLEAKVYQAIGAQGTARLPREEDEAIRTRLEARGLVPTRAESARAVTGPMLLLLAAGGFGLAKFVVGLQRGRPVLFLLFLLLLVTFLAARYGRPPRLTPLGRQTLEDLQDRSSALKTTARRETGLLAPADLALAVALFGGDLMAGPLADLRALRRQEAAASGGCGSSGSSCGSSGCGGGCGGCGGCGG